RSGERWRLPAAGVHRGPAWASELYRANPICLSGAMIRRDALEGAGGFDRGRRRGEDWDLWLRLAAAGAAFRCVAEEVVRYRRHPGGLTADVAAVARSQIELHRDHAELVDEATRAHALAGDLRGLARGLVRERRYREAANALEQAS